MAQLKTDVGKTAGDHMDIMFGHGKSLLADKLEPMDLIRNSTAVSLNAVDALHRLYEAAYRFFQPR
ncbi:MAG TPA: hypothetical protein VMU50_17960 [Polyangia bacterium]|nr:hypothetical protein [Polyangia bacterium]